ncbi:phospholipase D family protein, partial [Mesorhizobium sp. M4B.F.Ca.ET.089.01.1.1]|uniref:phospholipase D family protein n=1 Tax=Mesorhizobium sp. M4B.F.Ca.ET.089.01.1.1 TaxID=2496662 RepID=UPI00167562F4
GQPYLDELRPGRLEDVRLALFATYSVDLSAVAATLLALIGRNNEQGSGTAIDFAQAIEKLRDRVRIVVQRGRIARPKFLPRIAGILDQFVVEQHHDEENRSWHPKIALIAYDCPGARVRWKLWIGSRNLTRSRDLDVGILLDGSAQRAKGRARLRGVGAMGASLARGAKRSDANALAAELDSLWWEPPAGLSIRALHDGLDEEAPLPAGPPAGDIDSLTIISPFLSPDFIKAAGAWGPDGARTLISSMPALVEMANRAGKPLSGFSRVLAYAAPELSFEEDTATLPGEDEEPAPLALHAKLYCFGMGDKTILRVGSANATSRAWSGENSEIM